MVTERIASSYNKLKASWYEATSQQPYVPLSKNEQTNVTERNECLVLSTELMTKLIWPLLRDSRADLPSVSPSSE